MSEKKTPEKKQDATSSPQDIRRRYIYERLINLHPISIADIAWKVNENKTAEDSVKVNANSVQEDMDFWKKTLGWEILQTKGAHNRTWWHRADAPFPAPVNEGGHMSKLSRKSQNSLEKQKIAQVALGVLIGSGSESELFADYKCRSGNSLKGSTLRALFSAVKEEPHLDPRITNSIINKLVGYANTSVRSAFLDASTTVDQVADLLARIHLPIEVVKPSNEDQEIIFNERNARYETITPSLQYLEAWTNNRYIFNKLGERDISIRSIVLPGWQDPENDSLCSYLATDFLERLDPQFSIAIIGAKFIDLKDGYFCTDHAADAKLIGQVIERSEIVVVVAASCKMTGRTSGAIKRCCKLVGKIDFVITDTISSDSATIISINKLRRSGVIFLSADKLFMDHAISLNNRDQDYQI